MIRQIQYFHSVVEHQNFTRAAGACYISQSAISQQIKALEDALEFALLKRKGRSIELTEAGSYFYEQTVPMIEQYGRICKSAAQLARYESSVFKVGYLRTYQGRHFACALAALVAEHPDLQIQIVPGSHEELFHMLDDGSLDLAFSDQRRAFSQAYHNEVMLKEQARVLLPKNHPLAFHDSLSAQEVRTLPCIVVAADEEQENEAAFYRDIYGIRSAFTFVKSMEAAKVLVLAGQGFMVLDDPLPNDSDLFACPILTRQSAPIERRLCLFWKLDREGYFHEALAEKLRIETGRPPGEEIMS